MRSIPRSINIVLLSLAPLMAQELKLPPGLAARAKETVEVTLDSNMLQIAARFLSAAKPDEAQAKKAIAGLKSIVVRSFEFEKKGEYTDADLDTIRAQFRGPGWSRMAMVRSKKDGDNADVYVKTENGNVAGLGAVVAEPEELTVVYIVGAIDPAQIGALTGKFGIPDKILRKEKKTGKED